MKHNDFLKVLIISVLVSIFSNSVCAYPYYNAMNNKEVVVIHNTPYYRVYSYSLRRYTLCTVPPSHYKYIVEGVSRPVRKYDDRVIIRTLNSSGNESDDMYYGNSIKKKTKKPKKKSENYDDWSTPGDENDWVKLDEL